MSKWIRWNGGECPIKSGKTRVEYMCRDGYLGSNLGTSCLWDHTITGYLKEGDIVAYRITENHEPMDYDASPIYTHKMTREQITAQIEALQEQLVMMPVVVRKYWDGSHFSSRACGTHCFDIEIVNHVPVSVTIKEVGK